MSNPDNPIGAAIQRIPEAQNPEVLPEIDLSAESVRRLETARKSLIPTWMRKGVQLFAGACLLASASEFSAAGDEVTLKTLRRDAEAGNPAVQTTLALHYAMGRTVSSNSTEKVPVDDIEASKWFLRAARQGQPVAQFNIGVRYASGRGIRADATQAYKWLTLAAKSDFAQVAGAAQKLLVTWETNLNSSQIADAKLLAERFVVVKEGEPPSTHQSPSLATAAPTPSPSGSDPAAPNMRWDDKLQGHVIVMNATSERPTVTALRWPLKNIPTQAIKSTDEFVATELHTDVKILSIDGETAEKEPIIRCIGKITYLTEGPFSGKMRSLVGQPGTRLDISALAKNGKSLSFLNKKLVPTNHTQSLLLIRTNMIQALNVEITDVGQEGKLEPQTDRIKMLGRQVQSGKWAEARDSAKRQLESGDQRAAEIYVLDVANDVLNQPRKQLLSEYDFPYSDKPALKEVQILVNDLLKSDAANSDVLILSAMLLGPKALNNASEFTAVLEKASKGAPTNAFILTALGSAYGAQGRISLAVETLEKAISLDDNSSSAHANLGVALLKKGETSRAVKEMEKAVQLDETNPTAWFNLGSYHAERNSTAEARKALEKTIELDPKLLEARWNLGGIYFNSGQQAKAVEQLREIIKIGPDSAMGRQASHMLRQLGK